MRAACRCRYAVCPISRQEQFQKTSVVSRLANVPRKNPVPNYEKQIADRFRAAREKAGLKQTELARKTGMNVNTLSAYEHGAIPVPYRVGDLIAYRTDTCQRWLFDGRSPQKPYLPVDEVLERVIPPKALFSEVYAKMLSRAADSALATLAELSARPRSTFVPESLRAEEERPAPLLAPRTLVSLGNVSLKLNSLEFRLITMGLTQMRVLSRKLDGLIDAVLRKSKGGKSQSVAEAMEEERRIQEGILSRLWNGDETPGLDPGEFKKTGESIESPLDVVIESDDNSQMPPVSGSHLPVLIERLKRALVGRGAKAQLARELGVPRQSVNAWLSGARMPDGETTLTLQHWVTAAEAKQKDPDRALTQSGRKTRSAKSKANEKVQPDRPKA